MDKLYERLTEDAQSAMEMFERIRRAEVGTTVNGRYRHWDKLRQMTPPAGLTSEDWWFGIKLAREPLRRKLPLTDPEGRPARYCMPDEALELLHHVDQHAAGEVAMPEVVLGDSGAKRQYLVNSLIEEAIRSSQLEGATTSRRVAKEMIQSGREPRNRSERMILNNYRGMEFVRGIEGELTPAVVLELHRILTEGTLDDPDAAGRLQTEEDERVAVYDRVDGRLLYRPPPASQLPDRFAEMLRFANGATGGTGFLHPVVRAILTHFWLSYDHPFEDGNGRTARALFYWSMRSQGYWATDYLSISAILRAAPGRYARAFLHTETDDLDTTYFIMFHLGVIKRAVEQFHSYVQRKTVEIRKFDAAIRESDEFNYRQLGVLRNAIRHPETAYTFRGHALSHAVTHESARQDLTDLMRRGLMERRRIGRQYVFRPVSRLAEKLRGELHEATTS